ncbi:MAG TPA: hypothetical protein VI282_10035 [Verrucomicrobiae bacterium]|jgi:hypothetical protein
MIQLHPDCLIFETSAGESIPCSAEVVTIELVGDSNLDPQIVREAAAAVVYYFRQELGRDNVSVEEFSNALQKILCRLGYKVSSPEGADVNADEFDEFAIANLPELATSAGKGCELFFFQRLRAELRTHLQTTPRVVRFQGLRSCVKQLAGRQRWCPRCQTLSDQIVEYLRECFTSEQANDCNLVVV